MSLVTIKSGHFMVDEKLSDRYKRSIDSQSKVENGGSFSSIIRRNLASWRLLKSLVDKM